MLVRALAPLFALVAATSAVPFSDNTPLVSVPEIPLPRDALPAPIVPAPPSHPALEARATVSNAPAKRPSKRGVIVNPIPKVAAPFSQYKKIVWDMNWWHGAPPAQPDKWLFIPQLTHLQPDQYWPNADFRHNVSKFPYIASFLEPNGQVSIPDAVASWNKNLQPLTKQHTVLPPMVGQNGLGWLKNFTAACKGCTLNKGPVAFTCYAWANNAGVADFKHHVNEFKAAYPGREIWVANMGVLGKANDTAVEWLMRQLVHYLDNEPAVTRYAWNGAGSFWDKNNSVLTPLARLYATL